MIKRLAAAIALALPLSAYALSNSFSYQGSLNDGGSPASGSYDLQFQLQTSAGANVGAPLVREDVAVAGGLFSVELDFGAAITSSDFRLQIGVRPGASTGAFTTLSPTTNLRPTPQAQVAGIAGEAVTVSPNAITSAGIADGSVTGADIQDGTINSADIADGSVGLAHIDANQVQRRVVGTCAAGSSIRDISATGAVTCEPIPAGGGGTVTNVATGAGLTGGPITASGTISIASGGVTSALIADGTVANADLAANAVNAGNIVDGAVGNVDIAANAVTTTTIADGAVGNADLAANAVASGNIVDGSVGSADINSAQVQARVTGTCAAGSSIRDISATGTVTCEADDGTGTVTSVASGAGLTGGPITASGTLSIATGGVTSSMIADGTVANADLAANSVNAGNIVDGSVGSADVNTAQVQARVTGNCAAGSSVRSVTADGSVTCEPDDVGITSTAQLTSAYPVANFRSITIPGSGVGDMAAATGADGLPLLAYYEPINGDLAVLHCDLADCSTTTRTIVDSTGDVGRKPRLVIAGSGASAFPLITYFDQTNTVIKALRCNDAACTTSVSAAITATAGAGPVHETARNGIGVFSVVFYDPPTGNVRGITCSNYSSCNAAFDIDASAANVGLGLVMGANGYRYYAYRNATSNHLILRNCSTTFSNASNCSATLTLDASGTVEDVHDLLVTEGRIPIVLYRKGGLEYTVSCTTPFCTAATTPEQVGGSGATSGTMTVGRDGYPLITLRGVGAATNSFDTRCTTPTCSSNFPLSSGVAGVSMEARPAIVRSARDFPIVFQKLGDSLLIEICDDNNCDGATRHR